MTTSESRGPVVSDGSHKADHPLKRRDIWLGIGAATATISIVGIGMSFGMPLLALILESRGVPGWIIGANTAVSGIASLLITPVAPRLTMMFGAAPLSIALVVLAAAAFPLFYVFDSLWVWFPLRFVFFSAITVLFVVSEFWINSLAPEARRGLIMGVYATVLYVGFAAGPLLLGLVGTGTALPFILCTAVLSLAAIPVAAAIRVSPKTEKTASPVFWPFLFAVPMATLAALVFGAEESSGMAFLAIYGARLGFEEATALSFVTALAIGGILFRFPSAISPTGWTAAACWLAARSRARLVLQPCRLFPPAMFCFFSSFCWQAASPAGFTRSGSPIWGAATAVLNSRLQTLPSSSCIRLACSLARHSAASRSTPPTRTASLLQSPCSLPFTSSSGLCGYGHLNRGCGNTLTTTARNGM